MDYKYKLVVKCGDESYPFPTPFNLNEWYVGSSELIEGINEAAMFIVFGWAKGFKYDSVDAITDDPNPETKKCINDLITKCIKGYSALIE